MSWISNIADKAEGILNKIDQNTAALTTPIADNGISTTLDVMRKSLSNSTNSLKSTLSPARGSSKNVEIEKTEKLLQGDGGEQVIAINIDEGESPGLAALADSKIVGDELELVSSLRSTPVKEFTNAESLNSTVQTPSKPKLKDSNLDINQFNKQLTTERDKLQQQLNELQQAYNSSTNNIAELEANYAKLYQQYTEIQNKLQMQADETAKYRLELQEYRSKAQRTLHMKDALIAELKATHSSEAGGNSTESQARYMEIEYKNLKQEHKQEQEANALLKLQLETLQKDLQALKARESDITRQQQVTEEQLQRQLRAERERNVTLESEQRMLTQDLAALRQELNEQMANSAARLQQKQQELERYQKSNSAQAQNTSDESKRCVDEYDERIRMLTQTLVDKQSAIERLTSDGNALRIQLENMQRQLQISVNNERLKQQSASNALLMNTTDDVKAQFPTLITPNPFDNRVARRVKNAYSSVDSAGIRLGTFLRRYPLIRIVVLCYVLLLHIWVMFVLLWSTPN